MTAPPVPGADPSKTGRRNAAPFVALILLAAILTLTAPALANGGIVRISSAPVGPWLVTVYSSPTPLRTGEVDISVLVQDSANAIVDVPIVVEATALDTVVAATEAAADRRQATNKLFKAAKFHIGAPGRWEFRIRIGSAAEPGSTAGPSVSGEAKAAGQTGAGGEGEPGGVVSFEAVVAKSTILDRPVLLATLVLLPLLVLGWFLLGREQEDEAAEREKPAAG